MATLILPGRRPRDYHLPSVPDVFAWVRLKWRIARDIKHLEEMSDDHLRDIGMRRDTIRAAVRLGRDQTLADDGTSGAGCSETTILLPARARLPSDA